MDAAGGIPGPIVDPTRTVAARIGASIMTAPCHGSDAQDSFAPMAAHPHAVASAPEQGVLRTGHNLLMGGPSEHEWKPLQSRAPLQRRHIIFIQRNISRKLLVSPEDRDTERRRSGSRSARATR
jgi:hypothetical protein